MITENQKKEIDKKYFPNGFFYHTKNFNTESQTRRLNEPFESLELYDASVKNLRHSNALRFYLTIKPMNENDFIKEINNQYLNYTIENFENAELWLSLTYDLVIKGFDISGKIEDMTLRGAFLKWYNEIIKTIPVEANQLENKLSIKQIALKLVYENINVTKENADKIVKQYGHNSGQKLYQEYNFYHSRSDRTANPNTTKKVLENKINLFESVIELLSDEYKTKAIDECNLLKVHLLSY